MTCSGKCSRRRLVVLVIVASLLVGCGKGGSERAAVTVCPPVVGYRPEFQARAAAEVEALPEGSPLADMLSDYTVMRDQARLCSGRANG